MTPLLLALSLNAPAQPPAFVPPPPLPPGVRIQPQFVPPPPRPPVVYVPVPTPVLVAPGYPVYRPQPVPLVPPAVTLGEFSRAFTPTPGKHDVWVVHPATGQPVKVCFVLPGGRLREFEVDRRSIRFEFRDGDVEIDFRNNGTVNVRYN